MREPVPSQIVVGPRGHGVVEYATDLAEAIRRAEPSTRILHASSVADADALFRAEGRAHVHLTDGLFGATLEEAAVAVERLTSLSDVTATLHDLPQASDGDRNLARRSSAYAKFVERAAGVVVSSHHEKALYESHIAPLLSTATRVSRQVPRVIPLGTRTAFPAAAGGVDVGPSDRGPIGILMAGYVYPGKGHDEAIAAAAGFRSDGEVETSGESVSITVLGGASRSHEGEVDRLVASAAAVDVAFTVTGHLTDDDYRRRMRGNGVPLVAHRHYSASRSLLDWAEQGRRPVVVDTRYTREMSELRPGTLLLAGDTVDDLEAALRAAWQDPGSTYLDVRQPLGPTLDDAARAYLDWWRAAPQ